MMIEIRYDGTNKLTALFIACMQEKWKAEIEKAIDKIKNPRTEWDKRFRKEWHKAKWRRIHGWSRVVKKRATRLQDGSARRNENGKEK